MKFVFSVDHLKAFDFQLDLPSIYSTPHKLTDYFIVIYTMC
jgi:hypothetical protein